ncbi:MAG TPA: amylo-alpha-1,6-glucosidase [Thermoanaerobaculia bacterium]|nr:amylo-alpha-1,6-glucosidase [Thermoanaerobaculia bacterium]
MATTDLAPASGAPAAEQMGDDLAAHPLPLPVREVPAPADPERLVALEWLVANGLGGYAAGTIAGTLTRRHHGLLVAALPGGRVVVLTQLAEALRLPSGEELRLSVEERSGVPLDLGPLRHFIGFRLEGGLPVWTWRAGGCVVERRLVQPHGQNTVHVLYRLLEGEGRVRLLVAPGLAFRPLEEPVSRPLPAPFETKAQDARCEVRPAADPALLDRRRRPCVRLAVLGSEPAFSAGPRTIEALRYRVEEARGYAAVGDGWSPGTFAVDLAAGEDAALVASLEPWEVALALPPAECLAIDRARRLRLLAAADPRARAGPAAELVLAADQFLIAPQRTADAVRAHAAGEEPRTVVAGYHWFTDWGRDAMIALEGLTAATGRLEEARYALRTFAGHVRDGLIPNYFPDGEREGVYHTADATLWFFHALDRYVAASDDRATLEVLLPALVEIVERHLRGTRFGIGVDADDGLLAQGAAGYQLTWMDAKVGDWVVTPRRGKAVEVNALWYNALRLIEGWVREERGAAPARRLARHAERAWRSFNERFWYEEGGYLYDVIDGEAGHDTACRPNQVFAISLPHPVLARERWGQVLEVVRERLLTPVGLRSLAPGHPDYQACYDGDLRARDAAYHQGTVWGWLIGPFVDAWLKLHPADREGARAALAGFLPHLGEACLGTVSEIFDAEPPYRPRGCVSQAWSVAELLRGWLKTSGSEG